MLTVIRAVRLMRGADVGRPWGGRGRKVTGVSQVQRGGGVRNTEGEANGARCGGRWGLGPAWVSCPGGEDTVIQLPRPQASTSSLGKDSGFCSVSWEGRSWKCFKQGNRSF